MPKQPKRHGNGVSARDLLAETPLELLLRATGVLRGQATADLRDAAKVEYAALLDCRDALAAMRSMALSGEPYSEQMRTLVDVSLARLPRGSQERRAMGRRRHCG